MSSNTHENDGGDDDDCINNRRRRHCHPIMNEKLSYYEILNVPSSASTIQIKESYRTLIKQYHPDKCNNKRGNDSNNNTDNTTTTSNNYTNDSNCYITTTNTKSQQTRNQFIQIQLAWECLRDTQLRYQYDQELLQGLQNKQQQQDENKVEYIRQLKLQKNAIPIYITDCRSSIVGPEQEYDDNNNVTIDTTSTYNSDDDDDIVILDWIYQCRCGYDIFVAQQQQYVLRTINSTNSNDINNQTIDKDIQQQKQPYDLIPYSYITSENDTNNNEKNNDLSNMFVQCTGCSLMYDLRPLFTIHDR